MEKTDVWKLIVEEYIGVPINSKFKVEGDDEHWYRCTNHGLVQGVNNGYGFTYVDTYTLVELINKEKKIILMY